MKDKKPLLFLMLLLITSSLSLINIKINNTPSTYLKNDSDAKRLNDEIREVFNQDDIIIYYFENKNGYTKVFLESVASLIESIENIDQVKKVHSVFTTEMTIATQDGFDSVNILEIDQINTYSLTTIKQRLEKSDFAKNILFNKSHNGLTLLVEPTSNQLDSFKRIKLVNDIKEKIGSLNLNLFQKSFTGQMAVDVSQFNSMLQDTRTILPITFIVGLIIIALQFPSAPIILITVISLGVCSGLALSIFSLFSLPFNLISNMIPSLIMALTFAFLLHLYSRINTLVNQQIPLGRAALDAAKEINTPALFSALTTSIGLYSLSTSELPPVVHFGISAGTGVLIIYLIVIKLLPRIISNFPETFWKSGFFINKLFDKLVLLFFKLSIKYHKAIPLTIIILLLCGIPLIFKIKVETNILNFFKKNHSIVKDTFFFNDNLSGTTSVELILKDKNIMTRTNLDNLELFHKKALEHKNIDKVISPLNFIKEIHWAFNKENNEFRVVPPSDQLIDQYLLIYAGDDLYNYVNRDYDIAKVDLFLNVYGAKEIGKTIEHLEIIAKNIFNDIGFFDFSGSGKIFSYQETLLIEGQIKSIITSAILIFLFMTILWKSFTDAAICMLPNASPLISIFILMGGLGIWLDMGSVLIASVSIGIAVDDTIHIFHNFMYEIKKGASPIWALAKTYKKTGKAILSTTIVLSSQFLLLCLSDFIPIINFGLFTGVGLIVALIFDLTLLPALLYWLSKYIRRYNNYA